MPEHHALLSASAAARWLHCPPSARLCEHLPERTSPSAAEGTLAHRLAELALQKRYTAALGPKKYKSEVKAARDAYYKPILDSGKMTAADRKTDEKSMDNYVAEYIDLVDREATAFSRPPFVAIEQRIDYSSYAPGGFGTADCVLVGDETLVIIDFKYGQRPPAIEAAHNPQPMLYALGAADYYEMLYPIHNAKLIICQPRLSSISEWETTVLELREWGTFIKPTAQNAWDGFGDFSAGDWCMYCKIKATCRERAETYTALEDFSCKQPPELSADEIGDLLLRAEGLQRWAKDLAAYAHAQISIGNEIPGWKLVEGKSNRIITDIDAAINAAVVAGQPEEMLWKRLPITLTEMEKLLGKKPFAEHIGPYVTKPPGAPTLAQATDRRPAMTVSPTAEDDFVPVIGEE